MTVPCVRAQDTSDPKPQQKKTDATAPGDQPSSDAEKADQLRKAEQNPVSGLISVPFQENWNFGIGPAERVQNVLNVQPVIPVSLSQNWKLIVRWVTPIVYQALEVTELRLPPGPTSHSRRT